jgi:hypothetical protein
MTRMMTEREGKPVPAAFQKKTRTETSMAVSGTCPIEIGLKEGNRTI